MRLQHCILEPLAIITSHMEANMRMFTRLLTPSGCPKEEAPATHVSSGVASLTVVQESRVLGIEAEQDPWES